MQKMYTLLPLLAILALGGCTQKDPMLDEDIGPLIVEEQNTSDLPQSDARCEILDELEIVESFPLEEGEAGKYEPLEDQSPTINADNDEATKRARLVGRIAYGKASWYSKKLHGHKTANGERYNMYEYTAAHKQLPFNSLVKVTDIETGKSEVVRINDRGPYHGDRLIDVSYAAAKTLGLVRQGIGDVRLEILEIGFDPRCQAH